LKTRVLIADDSAFLRKRISEILSSSDEIVLIGTAKNGKEAIKKAIYQNPDVILLDLMMPKINGLQAFRRIMEENPTPTIILSSISPQTLDSSVQALLIGAFDYILKPGTLGAKKLPEFRKNLIEKILLASNSRFNKIYGKMEYEDNSKENLPFRQRWVDEVFEFGKYLKEIKPNRKKVSKNFKKNTYTEKFQPQNQTSDHKRITEKVALKAEESKNKKKKFQEKSSNKPSKIRSYSKHDRESKCIEDNEDIDLSKKELFQNRKERGEKIHKTSHVHKLFDDLEHKERIPQKIRKKEIEPKRNVYRSISGRKIPKIDSKIVVIGASVGGPKALRMILHDIPSDFPYPIVIVQHLNNHFIEPLAQSLDNSCPIKVKIAQNNEILKPSTVYIAPGEKHVKVGTKQSKPCLITYEGEPINSCIPSVDVLFNSVSEVYGKNVIGALLTGMGEDGVKGLETIHKNGGITITESQETAILFGMPKLAIEKGVVDRVIENYKIAHFLVHKAYY
jgi:two-component system chemotaxis response regulator CheB